MIRITISIGDLLAKTFDAMIAQRGYSSRSEAMRDILRDSVEKWRGEESSNGHCVASLSYVYDRRIGGLVARLAEIEHDSHDLVASSTTIRLDHEHSLVSVMLKGTALEVKNIAREISALRGVRFADVNMLAVELDEEHRGDHKQPPHHHDVSHLSPITR